MNIKIDKNQVLNDKKRWWRFVSYASRTKVSKDGQREPRQKLPFTNHTENTNRVSTILLVKSRLELGWGWGQVWVSKKFPLYFFKQFQFIGSKAMEASRLGLRWVFSGKEYVEVNYGLYWVVWCTLRRSCIRGMPDSCDSKRCFSSFNVSRVSEFSGSSVQLPSPSNCNRCVWNFHNEGRWVIVKSVMPLSLAAW